MVWTLGGSAWLRERIAGTREGHGRSHRYGRRPGKEGSEKCYGVAEDRFENLKSCSSKTFQMRATQTSICLGLSLIILRHLRNDFDSPSVERGRRIGKLKV